MKKLLFLSFVAAVLGGLVFAENLTLTTYYPAPSGAYKNMRSHGMCVGTACTHATISDNNLSVQGRVGIGTTATPDYALQVGTGVSLNGLVGNSAFIAGDLEVSGRFFGNAANLTGLAKGVTGEVQYNDGADNLAGAPNFVFDPGTGNVGIGTTAPLQQLELTGNMLLPTAVPLTKGNLYFGGNTALGVNGLRLFSSDVNGGGFIDARTSVVTNGIIFRTDTVNGGTERMRITAGGNVGIGTSVPTATLEVKNTLRLTPVAGAQVGGNEGSLRYRSDTKQLVYNDGTAAWKAVGTTAFTCTTYQVAASSVDVADVNCPNDGSIMTGGGCFFTGEGDGSKDCYDKSFCLSWRDESSSYPSGNGWACRDRSAHSNVRTAYVRCCKMN